MLMQPAARASTMETIAHALEGSDNILLVMRRAADPQQGAVMLEANAAFCSATGLSPADLTETALSSVASAGRDQEILARIAEAAALGQAVRGEMLCVRAQGGTFWLGLHVMPSIDRLSGEQRLVLMGRDITERLLARQQDQAVQHLLARVFTAVDVAVGIVTLDGCILKSNPRLHRLVGQAVASLEGKPVADLIHAIDRPFLHDGLTRQNADGLEHRQRLRVLHADGTDISVDLTVALANSGEGQRFRVFTFAEQPSGADGFQVAGKIRMIGLDEVKAVLGPRWPALRARAVAAAEHVLHKRLGAKDSFSRTRDDGFLICFATLEEDAASFTAAMIGREIRARLIGQGEQPEATQVTAITANIAVAGDATIDPRPAADVLDQRLNARRAEIESRARQTLASAMATASCGLAPVVGRDGRQIVAHYARLAPALQRRLSTAAAALPEAERLRYDLDSLTLRLTGQEALEQSVTNRVANMFVDVSFDVFHSRPSTESYLESCRKLDPSVRQGFVLVMTHMPQGLTSSRMLDCVHRLRPFCRTVGFELEDIEIPDFDLAMANGPILVLDAERVPACQTPSHRLERLIAQARQLRARVMIRGVTHRSAADRLLASGVDLIAGLPPEAAADGGYTNGPDR